MSFSLTTISLWIISYGYLFILPISIIEGPIITVIAAFLAHQGYFNIVVVYFIVVLGDLIGDLLFYSVGFFGKRLSNTFVGRFFGLTDSRIKRVSDHFDVHSGKTIFWGKLTHSMGWAVLSAAGMVRMPIGRFLWFNFLGTLPKSLVFVLIGYYLGYAYKSIDSYISKIASVLFFVLLIAIFVYYRGNKKTMV